MPKTCPKCRLTNTGTAARCDCGYDFTEGAMRESLLCSEQQSSNIERKISWRTFALRAVAGYALFEILSQVFFPLPLPSNHAPAQKFVVSVLVHLMQYSAVLAITCLLAVLLVKVFSRDRSRPLPQFLNGALIVTLLFLGVFVFGGWYATNRSSISGSITASPVTARL